MLDKTKAVIKKEIAKGIVDVTTCSDPAPLLGSYPVNVLKALKEDLKEDKTNKDN